MREHYYYTHRLLEARIYIQADACNLLYMFYFVIILNNTIYILLSDTHVNFN